MKRILSREKQEKGAKIRPLGSKAVKSSRKNLSEFLTCCP